MKTRINYVFYRVDLLPLKQTNHIYILVKFLTQFVRPQGIVKTKRCFVIE